jgi:hypothetical protein
MDGFCVVPDNGAPTAVFGIPPADYNPTQMRIGRWDPDQGAYVEYPMNGQTVVPGWGAWMLFRNSRTIQVSGTAPEVSPGPDGETFGLWFDVQKGWNQAANPFCHPISAAGVQLVVGDTATLATFYYWDGSGDYKVVSQNGVLTADFGGWVKASADGRLFFAQAQAAAARASASDNFRALRADEEQPPPPPGGLNESSGGGGGGGGGCFLGAVFKD